MSDVEFLNIGEYSNRRRTFDAVSYGRCFWQGVAILDTTFEPPRIYVYSDRNNLLDGECAIRPGHEDELSDNDQAKTIIAKAIDTCFDHTYTTEAIRGNDGELIPLETDT